VVLKKRGRLKLDISVIPAWPESFFAPLYCAVEVIPPEGFPTSGNDRMGEILTPKNAFERKS
jgi:hypothetical protein